MYKIKFPLFKWFARFSIIILLVSCNSSNPCEFSRQGSNYILSDTLKEYISNYEDTEKIIFRTNNGDEVEFIVQSIQTSIENYQINDTCEFDIEQEQIVTGTSENAKLALINSSEFLKPIYISLLEFSSVTSFRNDEETLGVTYGDYLSKDVGLDGLLFFHEPIGDGGFAIFHDSLNLGGEWFYNVYEPNNRPDYDPIYDIKYTKEQGVVYIGSPDKEYFYLDKK